MHLEIPLGFKKGLKNPPRPGFRGRLLLTASPWNNGDGKAAGSTGKPPEARRAGP